jgi:hypothetical protein
MKKLTVLTVIFLAIAFTTANAAEFKGYLSDALCGTSGMDPAGNDLTMNPERHSIEIMRTPGCITSGYGIFIYNNNYKKFIFYKFDPAGSGMAKEQIVDKFNRSDNVAIVVDGEFMDNGTIKVNRIWEDKPIRTQGSGEKDNWWQNE